MRLAKQGHDYIMNKCLLQGTPLQMFLKHSSILKLVPFLTMIMILFLIYLMTKK